MEVAELWLDKHEAVEIAKYLLEHDTDLNAVDKVSALSAVVRACWIPGYMCVLGFCFSLD